MPTASDHLTLTGDERDGHVFWLRVEEPIPDNPSMRHGEWVQTPWLRPCCSCGWVAKDKDRYAIEENAHWRWLKHVGVM